MTGVQTCALPISRYVPYISLTKYLHGRKNEVWRDYLPTFVDLPDCPSLSGQDGVSTINNQPSAASTSRAARGRYSALRHFASWIRSSRNFLLPVTVVYRTCPRGRGKQCIQDGKLHLQLHEIRSFNPGLEMRSPRKDRGLKSPSGNAKSAILY